MFMPNIIVLIRGVMPSGKNVVPMARLKEALEAAGLKDVRTYIQSGNVIFNSRFSQASLAVI
jgi:uncharacterized protein (DUF1697 family)